VGFVGILVGEETTASKSQEANRRQQQDMMERAVQYQESQLFQSDTTFEMHYSIGDLAKQWRLGRETVRLLVKDEPGVLKIQLGRRKALTRYSVPESVARRVHTKLSMANYQIGLNLAVFEVLIRLPGWCVLKDALF
jgi:hypothetical protein